MNSVVARYTDGRTLKGETSDFVPAKDLFHILPAGSTGSAELVTVKTGDLKALFFVKDLAGDPAHTERREFDPSRPQSGRRIKVRFKDGEILLGTTQGYHPGRPGFFMVPADSESNIERCYVVASSTMDIEFV